MALQPVAPEEPGVEKEMFGRVRRIHLIGIGGTGMSGIAEILLNLDFTVTGSDARRSEVTRRLEEKGAIVVEGHRSDLAAEADVVVVSSAIDAGNPELLLARSSAVPVIPRAEMLAELMRVKRGIAIGGAHGKTTTTWLTSLVLAEGGLDPTVVVGGRLKQLGTNAKLGAGDLLVAEADESDGTFLMLTPAISVVTNIDREHLDFYDGLESIEEAFLRFMNRVPFFGVTVANLDDRSVRNILPRVTRRTITFGIESTADIRARSIEHTGRAASFTVSAFGREEGRIRLRVPGRHNVLNSLAAVAVGIELEIPFSRIAAGLESFRGIQRRLEIKGEFRGRIFIDDYGHHPTEVKATLASLREAYPNRRLVVLFQPHRYSRTKFLLDEFGDAFADAHRLFLLDIYPAGEEPIPGIDSGLVQRKILDAGGPEARWFTSRDEAAGEIAAELLPGDLFLTLGAGDVWRLGEEILVNMTGRRGGAGG